jgi:hypothetical protein
VSGRLVARMLMLAFAFTLLVPGAAWAEKRSLSYELFAADKPAGTRTADLNYLPGDQGEVVTFESFTDVTLRVGRKAHHYKQRLGARFGGARSFSSSVSDNGQAREVQGQIDTSGNWDVTVVEGRSSHQANLPGSRVDLSYAELFDPDRALQTLAQVRNLRVLLTDTGAVLEGPIESLGSGQETTGNQTVQVHRFRWSTPDGQVLLSYTDDGLLVAYETTLFGRKLSARLVGAPLPRTYTETFVSPLSGQTVNEEGVR